MMNNAEYRAKIMKEMRKGGNKKKPKTVKQLFHTANRPKRPSPAPKRR